MGSFGCPRIGQRVSIGSSDFVQRKPFPLEKELNQRRRGLPVAILFPLRKSSLPGFCHHHSQAPRDMSQTSLLVPLSIAEICWHFHRRLPINTKREQKGSNYRKYKQHDNSQVSKVQVSQPQITTLEPKGLVRLPGRPRARLQPSQTGFRCRSWLLWARARLSPPALSSSALLEDFPWLRLATRAVVSDMLNDSPLSFR